MCVCARARARVQYAAVLFRICSMYLHALYMCSDLVVFILADNFGLFTEIAVCNFLRGLAVVLV